MKLRKIISIMIVIVGVGTASYPFISNYIYENQAKSEVTSLTKKVNDTNKKLIDKEVLRADEYNKNLLNSGSVFTDPFDEKKETLSKSYNGLLNMNADGMMGYIEILNRAKMFTDLTEMSVGDVFYITVLGKRMAYRVYDIKVIKPENIGILSIKPDKDNATLVTCTPYGINTHRLLVMGDYIISVLAGLSATLIFITVVKVINKIRIR